MGEKSLSYQAELGFLIPKYNHLYTAMGNPKESILPSSPSLQQQDKNTDVCMFSTIMENLTMDPLHILAKPTGSLRMDFT